MDSRKKSVSWLFEASKGVFQVRHEHAMNFMNNYFQQNRFLFSSFSRTECIFMHIRMKRCGKKNYKMDEGFGLKTLLVVMENGANSTFGFVY